MFGQPLVVLYEAAREHYRRDRHVPERALGSQLGADLLEAVPELGEVFA